MALDSSKISRLRNKIDDKSSRNPSFSIYITDTEVTYGAITITDSLITTAITGGTVTPLSISLTGITYNTVKKVCDYINTQYGYNAEINMLGDYNYSSVDLFNVSDKDILNKPFDVYTNHSFDDTTLTQCLTDALYSHLGTKYTWDTLPVSEEYAVILKAAIMCLTDKATTFCKYYPVDTEGSSIDKGAALSNYLDLLDRLEKEYEALISGSSEGGPTITEGQLRRKSRKVGIMSPYAIGDIPSAVLLNEGYDIGTDSFTISWSMNTDPDFYSYRIYYTTTSGTTVTIDNSTLYAEITDRGILHNTFTDMTTGTTYYIRVVCTNRSTLSTNDLYSYSNQIEVETD